MGFRYLSWKTITLPDIFVTFNAMTVTVWLSVILLLTALMIYFHFFSVNAFIRKDLVHKNNLWCQSWKRNHHHPRSRYSIIITDEDVLLLISGLSAVFSYLWFVHEYLTSKIMLDVILVCFTDVYIHINI